MDWINLHTPTLDSPEFLGAEPVDRATWLCLLRYCIGQENGGTMRDCASWGDRKWQQLCRVTQKEAARTCDLWAWLGEDLIVRFYPLEKEQTVQARRVAGRLGGASRSEAKVEAARRNGAKRAAKQTSQSDPTEGEGEGEGKEKGIRSEAPPDLLGVVTPGPPPEHIDPEQRWPYVRRLPWAQAIHRVVGNKIGKANWPQWERLVERFTEQGVVAGAESLAADNRWPDQVEPLLVPLLNHSKTVRPPANPVLDQAYAVVDRLGWTEARKRLTCPAESIRSDADIRDAMRENPELAAEMVRERA